MKKWRKIDPTTNDEMLELLRKERPNQVIHEVISFKKNDYGFYDVEVDMESMFLETKVLHTKCRLPYPYKSYEKMSEKKKMDWRWE